MHQMERPCFPHRDRGYVFFLIGARKNVKGPLGKTVSRGHQKQNFTANNLTGTKSDDNLKALFPEV